MATTASPQFVPKPSKDTGLDNWEYGDKEGAGKPCKPSKDGTGKK